MRRAGRLGRLPPARGEVPPVASAQRLRPGRGRPCPALEEPISSRTPTAGRAACPRSLLTAPPALQGPARTGVCFRPSPWESVICFYREWPGRERSPSQSGPRGPARGSASAERTQGAGAAAAVPGERAGRRGRVAGSVGRRLAYAGGGQPPRPQLCAGCRPPRSGPTGAICCPRPA